jgi:Plasma-membrane choline transporter
MIKDRGVEALINDNLIGNVLFMGGLLAGVITSLFGYIYMAVARPAFNQYGTATPIVVMVCFIIGLSMFSSIATVITSGVSTTFVCLAEDPDALQRYRKWKLNCRQNRTEVVPECMLNVLFFFPLCWLEQSQNCMRE